MQNGKVVVYNVQGRQNRVQGNNARGVVAAGNGGAQYRASTINAGQGKGKPNQMEKMLLMQAQENGVDLDEEQLLFLTGGQTHTFDDEVDEGPVQDMFMANSPHADPVYDRSWSILMIHDTSLEPTNKDQVVHNDVSSVPNDVVMIISNNIYEHDAPCVTSNNTVNVSLTAELARYKELVEVKDKLYKQDQSLQTVNMLCKPKSFYDEVNWVAIGYKNPFYLSKAKQVQPALYNGHEIVKTNHACALVHDSEDTLEIPKTTRKQMIEKMKDLENNREVHLEYLKHLKESVGTLRKIVEEARVKKPLDSSLASACLYTKHSHDLLEYVIGTCPNDFNKRDRKIVIAPLNRKKQVTFVELSHTDRPLVFELRAGSKHMTGDRSWLRNFMKKFIGIVRFGNDHFCAIMGYGDYMIGDSILRLRSATLMLCRADAYGVVDLIKEPWH
ncbi:hypothetical protein Tco_0448344 [Tanacetum coccineum]